MHREPEWDARTRNEAVAAVMHERRTCRGCGQIDTWVPDESSPPTWQWRDGRRFRVQRFRCLACGAHDTIARDFAKAHEQDKPEPGRFAAGDGVRWVVDEVFEEG